MCGFCEIRFINIFSFFLYWSNLSFFGKTLKLNVISLSVGGTLFFVRFPSLEDRQYIFHQLFLTINELNLINGWLCWWLSICILDDVFLMIKMVKGSILNAVLNYEYGELIFSLALNKGFTISAFEQENLSYIVNLLKRYILKLYPSIPFTHWYDAYFMLLECS